jgi:hypothetical protein
MGEKWHFQITVLRQQSKYHNNHRIVATFSFSRVKKMEAILSFFNRISSFKITKFKSLAIPYSIRWMGNTMFPRCLRSNVIHLVGRWISQCLEALEIITESANFTKISLMMSAQAEKLACKAAMTV